MNLEKMNDERNKLNRMLGETDNFFEAFGFLDDGAYGKGAIPKKYKELTGLAISVFTKCEECIAYHLQNCKEVECTKKEVVEALKMAVAGGGSVTLPWARKAIAIIEKIGFED